MLVRIFLIENPWVIYVSQIIGGLFIAKFIYPGLIYLSHVKKLNVSPGDRSSHETSTSVLGGVGIFFTFLVTVICSFLLYGEIVHPLNFLALLVALVLMFFMGLKDDMVGISPSRKAMVQVLTCMLFLFVSDALIVSFGSLFGINELPVYLSWIMTMFVYILGINAYNLIDGVDGLAGGIAIVAVCYFGASFAVRGDVQWACISFGVLGGVLGFLRFNLFGKRRIFMGDSGSMFIGFLLVSLVLRYLYTPAPTGVSTGNLGHEIIMMLALFCYPLVDVSRIFLFRIKNGHNPFRPDRNHLHHFLLGLGLSHRKVSFVAVLYTVAVLTIMSALEDEGLIVSVVVFLFLNILVALLPSIVCREGYRIIVRFPSFKSN